MKYDGNSSGRRLSNKGRRRSGGDEHCHLTAHQVSRQRRQSIIVAVRPAIFDCDIAALDVAAFTQAFAEGSNKGRVASGKTTAEKPDYRCRRLPLRMRSHWPGDKGAADPSYEVASSHATASPKFTNERYHLCQRTRSGMLRCERARNIDGK